MIGLVVYAAGVFIAWQHGGPPAALAAFVVFWVGANQGMGLMKWNLEQAGYVVEWSKDGRGKWRHRVGTRRPDGEAADWILPDFSVTK